MPEEAQATTRYARTVAGVSPDEAVVQAFSSMTMVNHRNSPQHNVIAG